MNHKEKFLHHKGLNLGCSMTIRNGAKSCIRFVVNGCQVFKNCYISLFVNDCEMSGTKNWRIQFIWNTISESWIKPSGPQVAHVYGAPFVKILYLTDLAQKLLSLAEIAISACRDTGWQFGVVDAGWQSVRAFSFCTWRRSEVVSCASFCTFRCKKRMLSQKERAESEPFDTLQRYLCMQR